LAAEASSTTTGPVAVDAKMPNHQLYKVFVGPDGKSYSGYLNCADLKNNNNKFYVCQVVQLQQRGLFGGSQIYFWTRYGRVGDNGVTEMTAISEGQAIKDFDKTMKTKIRKGYAELKMNLGEKKDTKDDATDLKDCQPCKLDP